MILRAYSVKDLQVQAFLPPIFARTDGEAARIFIQACANGGLKANPTDYEMYYIGTFNDDNGRLEHHDLVFQLNGHQALKTYNTIKEQGT